MNETVEPVTHGILGSLQAAIVELRAGTRTGVDGIRAQGPEERCKSAGTLVLPRATAGNFDLRLTSPEERVAALDVRV